MPGVHLIDASGCGATEIADQPRHLLQTRNGDRDGARERGFDDEVIALPDRHPRTGQQGQRFVGGLVIDGHLNDGRLHACGHVRRGGAVH